MDFQGEKALDIIIVDKTVPSLDRKSISHLTGFLQITGLSRKRRKPASSYRKDLLRFLPHQAYKEEALGQEKEYRLADLKDLPEKADAIYITDTMAFISTNRYQGISRSRRIDEDLRWPQ